MSWLPISGSTALRLSSRVALAIAIPGVITAWLLYSAAAQEESLHNRNLRWLAQSAGRIEQKVKYYDSIVRSAATLGPQQYAMARGLSRVDSPASCANWPAISVRDEGQGPELRLRRASEHKSECAFADLRTIVGGSIRDGAFDRVILARRDGRVLMQAGGTGLNITDVRFLFAEPEPAGIPSLTLSGTPVKATAKAEPGEIQTPSASLHLTRSIGDRKYGVYVQPLPVAMDDGSAQFEGDWLLIGLVEGSSLWRRATPRDAMIVFPFAVLLVLVSWPLPRLWYMQAIEPLRRRDLGHIAVCTLGVVLIFSFLGLYDYMRRLSVAATDDTLRTLALDLGRDLRYDLESAVQQLDVLNEHAGENPAPLISELFAQLPAGKIVTNFEFIDWIDQNGDKRIRWTPRQVDKAVQSRTGRLVSVGDRRYFREALASPPLKTEGLGRNIRFSVEQVSSRTTGDVLTMIAIPSGRPERLPVASMGVKLTSLAKATVPPDYGFAVIDSSGTVLFHSDGGRVFVENFFDECDGVPELKAVVQRRIEARLTANYTGLAHRLYVTPVPGFYELPWTLVAYRTLALSRLNRIQALVDAVVLYLAYAVATVLALWLFLYALYRISGAGGRPRCFVPRSLLDLAWWSRRQTAYPYVALAGLAVLVLSWRALRSLDGSYLLPAAVFCSCVFILVSASAMRRPGAARKQQLRATTVLPLPFALGLVCLALGDTTFAWAIPATLAIGTVILSWVLNRSESRPKGIQQSAWVVWSVEFALALCVLPVFFVGKLACEYEVALAGRATEWNIWNTEAARRRALSREIASLPGMKGSPEKQRRLVDRLGLECGGACAPVGFYGAPGFSTVVWSGTHCEAQSSPGPASKRCAAGAFREVPPERICIDQRRTPLMRAAADKFAMLLVANVELPSTDWEIGSNAREAQLRPAGGLWSWRDESDNLWLCSGEKAVARAQLPSFAPFGSFGLLGSGDGGQMSIDVRAAGLQLWFGLAMLAAAIGWWLETLRARVFFLRLRERRRIRPFDQEHDAGLMRVLMLVPAGQPRGALPALSAPYTRIDLAVEELPADTAELRRLPRGGLHLDHLEARFSDDLARRARLEMLEAALLDPDRQILVVSTIDPVRYLETGGAGPLGAAPDPSEIGRWRRVIGHFDKRAIGAPAKPVTNVTADVWDSCSEFEKLVLSHLVRHRLLNPNAGPVISGLIARGILRRRPSRRLDFASTRFREFVREMQPSLLLPGVDPAAKARNLPAYVIALVLLGVVLFVSQEELTTRLIGFLTSLMGGLEMIRRQFTGGTGAPGSKEK